MNRLFEINEGKKTFSGEIVKENKPVLTMFDDWDHKEINTDVPVGINMRLVRAMEDFLDIKFCNVNVRRIK